MATSTDATDLAPLSAAPDADQAAHDWPPNNLAWHGDDELSDGLVDLAVNVRSGTPPQWLRQRLSRVDLARYPDLRAAREAVAARHGRDTEQVLLTAGAAEAFVLIARAFAPRRAVVVHPQFTEPEIALRGAGHDVQRIVLDWPYTLDPGVVPDAADLVVVGNPTNPTSVVHPARTLRALARPGRCLVVDEAFADCIPGEPDSLAGDGTVSGLIVVRSLTKTWGLAGVRAGYLLAAARDVQALAAVQPRWAVSALAAEACRACAQPASVAEAQDWAGQLAVWRAELVARLREIEGVHVVPGASASFVLARTPGRQTRDALRARGFAVRRGDTFPGLGAEWIRIAVRDSATTTALAHALKEIW